MFSSLANEFKDCFDHRRASDTCGGAFAIEESDLDFLYNLLLEEETPLSSREMALAIIERRVEREAQAALRRESGTSLFLPKDSYEVGRQLVFPALDYASGTGPVILSVAW